MSANFIKKVAIVGAGGTQGKHIVESLLKAGRFDVTAITREDSKNTIASGVNVAKVNYGNHDSLVKALTGQDCLIVTMNVMAPEDTQSLLVKAAADANVPWVLPNEWGEDSNSKGSADIFLGPKKIKVRQEIESLGKSSWIGINCGFWYQYSLAGSPLRFGFDLNKRTAIFYGDGSKQIDTSTWPRVGQAVTNLLSLPVNANDNSTSLSSFKNKLVAINSFTVSQREMLDSLIRVTGTKESDWEVSKEPAEQRYKDGMTELKSGNRAGFIKLMYSRSFWDDAGDHTRRNGSDLEKLGLKLDEDLDQCTKEAVELAKQSA